MSTILPKFYLLLTIPFIILAANALAQLLPTVSDSKISNDASLKTYIVHVHPPNITGDLVGDAERENWYKSFLPNTTLDSGKPRLVLFYHHVISGFSAKLTLKELRVMKIMDGFLRAYPDRRLRLGTTHAPAFLGLNDQWKGLWPKANEGEGVIIGVVDSGVRHTHVSFQDDGTMPDPPLKWGGCCQFHGPCNGVPGKCNNKLVGARGAAFFLKPDDEIGHGTHVASTAAGSRVYDASVLDQAKGTAVGIAPRAHVAMYKACFVPKGKTEEEYECRESYFLSGIEYAIDDGVDVLSLSIDAPGSFVRSGVIKGTYGALKKGILASACAGNGGRGRNLLANDAPWILTVGASSMDRVTNGTVELGDGTVLQGEGAYQPHTFDSTKMLDLVYPGEIIKDDDHKACKPRSLNQFNVKGKIVVCENGITSNVNKSEVVRIAGGAAMLLLSPVWDGFTIKSDALTVPTVWLGHVDSVKVVFYFNNAKNPTAKISFGGTQTGVRRAPAVASFSSRGPSLINGGILKPDIVGPGVDIVAGWHKQVGPNPTGSPDTAFNFASGCSMATPVLAGIIALLKSIHPDWSPAMIKSAIMTTAHTTDRRGMPIADEKSNTYENATYFAMGAGHVNPAGASDPGLVYDNKPDDYIGYLCGLNLASSDVTMIVKKVIDCSIIQKIHPEQLNYPSISVWLGSSSPRTIRRTVTYVGDAKSEYEAEVVEPDGASVIVIPNKLSFIKVNETKSFSVTFNAKPVHPARGQYSEGHLVWKSKGFNSNKYNVRSPISVKF